MQHSRPGTDRFRLFTCALICSAGTPRNNSNKSKARIKLLEFVANAYYRIVRYLSVLCNISVRRRLRRGDFGGHMCRLSHNRHNMSHLVTHAQRRKSVTIHVKSELMGGMTAVLLEPAGRARESAGVLLWCLFGFVY